MAVSPTPYDLQTVSRCVGRCCVSDGVHTGYPRFVDFVTHRAFDGARYCSVLFLCAAIANAKAGIEEGEMDDAEEVCIDHPLLLTAETVSKYTSSLAVFYRHARLSFTMMFYPKVHTQRACSVRVQSLFL